jgi:hypothetical protein
LADDWLGHGIAVTFGAQARLTGVRLHDNHREGLAVEGQGGAATVIGALIDGTKPDANFKVMGAGTVARAGTELALHQSRLVHNQAAAVYAEQGAVTVAGSVLGATRPRKLVLQKPDGTFEAQELADGLVVTGGTAVTVARCLFHANARAGVLLDGTQAATVERSTLVGGQFGLAWQGGTALADKTNLVAGAAQARASDEGLPLPKLAPPVQVQ